MTPEDLPDMLPYSTDSENISHRKERLQALGNAIVPQVGMVAFLVLHDILTQLFTTTSENC